MVACPFRALVFCTGCWQYLPSMKWLMYGILFLRLSTSLGCFCPQTFFSQNGLDKLVKTSFMSDLYTKLRIISRSVPGLVTDSPCSVWGFKQTSCLLCDGPLLGLYFNDSRCVHSVKWRGIFYTCVTLFLFLYIIKVFLSIFLSNDLTLK